MAVPQESRFEVKSAEEFMEMEVCCWSQDLVQDQYQSRVLKKRRVECLGRCIEFHRECTTELWDGETTCRIGGLGQEW